MYREIQPQSSILAQHAAHLLEHVTSAAT